MSGLVEFEETGRLWLRGAVTVQDLEVLDAQSAPRRPGVRLQTQGALASVFGPEISIGRALSTLWPGMRPVRIVSFTKDGETNWGVPWHQDRVIAVQARSDLPGFSNWSNKGGRWHCEPPLEVLEPMLFVRVHLDPSTSTNGAMEIALGSHKAGVVAAEAADEVASACRGELCLAEPGDVLMLKMLTLHRSRPAESSQPRRALRVDFASTSLPEPLTWTT